MNEFGFMTQLKTVSSQYLKRRRLRISFCALRSAEELQVAFSKEARSDLHRVCRVQKDAQTHSGL